VAGTGRWQGYPSVALCGDIARAGTVQKGAEYLLETIGAGRRWCHCPEPTEDSKVATDGDPVEESFDEKVPSDPLRGERVDAAESKELRDDDKLHERSLKGPSQAEAVDIESKDSQTLQLWPDSTERIHSRAERISCCSVRRPSRAERISYFSVSILRNITGTSTVSKLFTSFDEVFDVCSAKRAVAEGTCERHNETCDRPLGESVSFALNVLSSSVMSKLRSESCWSSS